MFWLLGVTSFFDNCTYKLRREKENRPAKCTDKVFDFEGMIKVIVMFTIGFLILSRELAKLGVENSHKTH